MTASAVRQVTKSERPEGNTGADITDSRARPFTSWRETLPHLGEAKPGLSPELTPSLRTVLRIRLPSNTDYLGDLRRPRELDSTSDGHRFTQAAGRGFEASS